jgi:membrane protease YdiL (CAAX protease family)
VPPLPPTPRPPRLTRAHLILGLYATLSLVAVGWGALRGQPNVFVIEGVPRRTLEGLALAVALALAAVFADRLAVHRFEWARAIDREFRSLLGPLSTGEVLLLAAASSVGEEAFFRGAVQPHLGLWLTSALFALPHVGPGVKFLPWTAASFVAGLAFGKLFVYTGDLSAPICAHFLINLINLRFISDQRR